MKEGDDSVDAYFQNNLRYVCMWTSIRHLLFTKLLADQSQVFLWEDLKADPVDWHGRFLSFVGLKLPFDVIVAMSEYATSGGHVPGYPHAVVENHPGGKAPQGGKRTFRDELGPESLAMMDDVVRTWVPPVLLQRFGIDP